MGGSVREILANNVRNLRLDLGLSLRELTDRSGVDTRSISRIEAGEQNVTIDVLERLAAVFGVSVPELLTDPNQAPGASVEHEFAQLERAVSESAERLARLRFKLRARLRR